MEAQENLRKSGLEYGLVVCDAQSLPFDRESFDAVVANHMLYRVHDRQRAYSEIRRVLEPAWTPLRVYSGSGAHART